MLDEPDDSGFQRTPPTTQRRSLCSRSPPSRRPSRRLSHVVGLALLPFARRLPGCQPPSPAAFFGGLSRRSKRCECRNELANSFDGRRRCIKLQKPPRLHSPFSFWRQHASRKSVTGESSAYSGRPGGRVSNHFNKNPFWTYRHTTARSDYRQPFELRFPIHTAHKHCQ